MFQVFYLIKLKVNHITGCFDLLSSSNLFLNIIILYNRLSDFLSPLFLNGDT